MEFSAVSCAWRVSCLVSVTLYGTRSSPPDGPWQRSDVSPASGTGFLDVSQRPCSWRNLTGHLWPLRI